MGWVVLLGALVLIGGCVVVHRADDPPQAYLGFAVAGVGLVVIFVGLGGWLGSFL
jgi:uncharacterized membrane protein